MAVMLIRIKVVFKIKKLSVVKSASTRGATAMIGLFMI